MSKKFPSRNTPSWAVWRDRNEQMRAKLRIQLADSYAANAARDQQLAEDWFPIEQEASDRG